MVVFDSATLLLALDPSAKPPNGVDGQPVPHCKERVEHLLDTLTKSKTTVLIPTPVLAEFLVGAGPNKKEYVEKIDKSRNFEWGAFDVKAAIELSLLVDPDLDSQKKLDPMTTKAKLKYDRQIIAITKVRGAARIYTDDKGLADRAKKNGIEAVVTENLPLPPTNPQASLDFPTSDDAATSSVVAE